MTLYNKDGTVYKLNGPNPLMKAQDFWEDFSTHNMNWKPEIHKDDKKNEIKENKKTIPDYPENSFIKELELSKEEELPTQEPKIEVKSKNCSVDNENLHIEKTFIYCLPSFFREKKDALYDDISVRIQYKEKTSFEAVIIKQNDMKIEMWSEVLFNEGSILYPKNGDKRWWKLQNSYPKLGGYIIQAVPSQEQPHFE